MDVVLPEGTPAAFRAATMCEAFQISVAARGDHVALRTKGDGIAWSWRDYGERVRAYAAGFAGLGVAPHDAVALLLLNRPHMNVVDMAALHVGAVPFSIYATSTVDQMKHLLADSAARVIVTEKLFLPKVRAAAVGSKIEHVISIDGDGDLDLDGLAAAAPAGFDFDARWRAVTPEHLLTIIYTSGTTGAPKGVELTHANMMFELCSFQAVRKLDAETRAISYLPSAHIADRMGLHYLHVALGGTVTACPDPRALFEHVAEVHPTEFTGMPRVWEKLKAGLEAKFAAEAPERAALVRGAIDAGLARVRLEQAGQPVPEALAAGCARAEQMIFAPLRAAIGFDRTRAYFTGAAPTPRDVLELFHAINVPIAEVWGMSELSCVGTANPIGAVKIGTVGQAMPGVELHIAGDGEILVRGPIVMRRYRNLPEQTRETIDADGWLHTGDIGQLDADGFLKIVDRKKEIIINANGKNMSPANIEATIKGASPLIGQACVIGDMRPFNVALIVLDPDGAMAFARAHGLDLPLAKLVSHDGLRAAVDAAMAKANEQLSQVEQIKRYALLPDEWLPAGDELTPTMKLRRKPIAAKYADRIDALYR
ncbi:MAG TPA: long-chain fatty acid--CoA ligase [Kofleriaceae bacterium]|jgi:long-subunit acyl-CoA synthetase (AMP-forming)